MRYTLIAYRFICAALLLLCAVNSANIRAAETAAAPTRVAVELTYLRALDGQREDLTRFVIANWFAMDKEAVKLGLMARYELFENDDPAKPWDVVVVVTYRDARGYAGIAPAFEKIRAAHQRVLINGKALNALGKIVESQTLYRPAQ
jgi:hypothetical protein